MVDFVENGARARARLERELTSHPDRAELLSLAASTYVAERDFAKAEQVLRHLIEVDPSSMQGYLMLGQVYVAQKKLDAGKAEFEKRLRLNQRDITAHLIAMIHQAQLKLSEAAKRTKTFLRSMGVH